MTLDEMRRLKVGDLVRHPFLEHAYVVTANLGNRITAVRTVDVTNPAEWEAVTKPRIRRVKAKEAAE